MANPYYIQKRRSPLIDYAKFGLQLYGLKQRGEIAKGQKDVDMKRLALEETKTKAEYGTPDPAMPGGGTGLQQQAQTLAGQKFTEEQRQFDAQNRYKVQWGKHMDEAPSEVNLIGLKNRVKVFEAPINRLLEGIEKGDIKTRWDAYHSLKPTEAVLIKESKDALEKEILGLKKKGKDGEAEELGQLYSQLRPGFLEKFFGFPPDMQPGTEGRATVTRPPTLKAPAKPIGLIEQEAAARAKGTASVTKTPTPEKPSIVERRGVATGKDLGELELLITDDTASETEIATFNRHSKQPYLYLRTEEPGTLYGTNTVNKRIDLPKINGKQVTAKDVAATAEKYGKTIEEVLADLGFNQ